MTRQVKVPGVQQAQHHPAANPGEGRGSHLVLETVGQPGGEVQDRTGQRPQCYSTCQDKDGDYSVI